MWKQTAQCSHLNEPNFETNPDQWFDWNEECMTDDGESGGGDGGHPRPHPLPPCKPHRYFLNGRCWQVVCTDEGKEVRPCEPIHVTTGDYLTSLVISGNGYKINVQSPDGFKSFHVRHHEIKLSHLGAALLNQHKLPSNNLGHIKPDFWHCLTNE